MTASAVRTGAEPRLLPVGTVTAGAGLGASGRFKNSCAVMVR